MFRAMVGWAGAVGSIGAGASGCIGAAATGCFAARIAGCPAGEVARIGVRFKYCSDGFIEFCADVDFVASGDRNPDGGGLFTR